MIKTKLILVLIIFSIQISVCFSKTNIWKEDLTQNSTWIDWTDYTVYASSNATTNSFFPDYISLKKEKINLMNLLYNATLNIEIKKDIKIKDLLNRDGKILLWKRINNTRYQYMIKTSKNSYFLQIGVNILGDICKKIFPMSFILKQDDVSFESSNKIKDYFKGYTGVVIEVSTDKFRPSLLLWIYSKDKELLFSPKIADYEVLIDKGIALYLDKFDKQLAQSRVGNNPLFLEADAIYDEEFNSLVLNENSYFYLKFPSILNLIKQGKLVITKKGYSPIQEENINEFNIKN